MVVRKQTGTRKAFMDVFEKHGYFSAAQIARTAIKRGLIKSSGERSLASYYAQLIQGSRNLPDKHAKVFMELCENDPSIERVINNLNKESVPFYLNRALDLLYGRYKHQFLGSYTHEKLSMLGRFEEFVNGENSRKSLEDQVE